MKALSFTQPWLWAILHGGKRVENRVWKGCSYRGPILLHAAKGIGTRDDFDDTAETILLTLKGQPREDFLRQCLAAKEHRIWTPAAALLRGGIVGKARIAGVIHSERDMAVYLANVPGATDQRAWWFGGFALVLADVRPIPFVPYKGALGLFEVPESQLGAQE